VKKFLSWLDFRLMAVGFKFRDFFLPRKYILQEVGIKPGFYALDYGCGPGSYIIPLAELVGESGKVYALDINPIAIQMVKKIISKKRLKNVEPIESGCQTGLSDNSIDVVLLYDTFHDLNSPNQVLKELRRILKPGGILSFSDHHMKADEIIDGITGSHWFRLSSKREKTYTFIKT